jgi:hypothetical protein
VSPRRKRPKRDDPLEVYRRIRTPMPPPERVVPDKRRVLEEEQARREIEEEQARREIEEEQARREAEEER